MAEEYFISVGHLCSHIGNLNPNVFDKQPALLNWNDGTLQRWRNRKENIRSNKQKQSTTYVDWVFLLNLSNK